MQLVAAAGAATLAVGVSRMASAAGFSAGAMIPECVVRPEMTEGPFFADVQLKRSDIRTEPSTGALVAGVPLVVTFHVSRIGGGACAPLPDAVVDTW